MAPANDGLKAGQAAPAEDLPIEDLEDLALSDDYALNPAFVEMVVDAADQGNLVRLRELIEALHPADLADLLGFLSSSHREVIVPMLTADELSETLSELYGPLREDILELVAPENLAKALGEMESDDAADVVDDLEDDRRGEVLAAMSDADRISIESAFVLCGRDRRPPDAARGAGRTAVLDRRSDHPACAVGRRRSAGAVLRRLYRRSIEPAAGRRAAEPSASKLTRFSAVANHGAGHRNPRSIWTRKRSPTSSTNTI